MRAPTAPANVPRHGDSYDTLPRKTKLPFPASDGLMRNVVSVTNPDDIYEQHYAKRERDLQILIRRYVNQILYGCHNPQCSAKTCLSYQKRVAKGPLRKYTALSARALACHLVSEPDPEAGLCPNKPVVPLDLDIKIPGGTRARKDSRIERKDSNSRREAYTNGTPVAGSRSIKPADDHPPSNQLVVQPDHQDINENGGQSHNQSSGSAHVMGHGFKRQVKKDPKSFTQNLFDTFTLRMLEWVPLKARPMRDNSTSSANSSQSERLRGSTTVINHRLEAEPIPHTTNGFSTTLEGETKESRRESTGTEAQKRRIRRHLSGDGLTDPGAQTELGVITNGTIHHAQHLPLSTPVEPAAPSLSPRESGYKYVDGSPDPQPPRRTKSKARHRHVEIHQGNESPLSKASVNERPDPVRPSLFRLDDDPKLSLDTLTPPILEELQTLAKLNRQPTDSSPNSALVDKSSLELEAEVISFIRQSLFFVLKDPTRLLKSVSASDDSTASILDPEYIYSFNQSLYSLRSAQEIHQHLWQGLRQLQVTLKGSPVIHPSREVRMSTSKGESLQKPQPSSSDDSLSDDAAAKYLAFVVYALARWLLSSNIFEGRDRHTVDIAMWKLLGPARASGLVMPSDESLDAVDGLNVVKPKQSYIDLLDRFDDEFVVRLVEEFIAVITNRLALYEISKSQKGRGILFLSKATRPPNILQLLFRNISKFREFQHQVLLYDGNFVSSFILEEVRSLFLRNWDGKAIAQRASSVGGAMQILAAMFEDKNNLGLLTADFVTPVLAERLDPLDMPVEWLSFRTNPKTLHLLSYSFLFPPEKVVTYFRAINFATMSKSFENALAFSRHVEGVAYPAQIHINENIRVDVFQQLKPAMAPYLVLQVRRDRVLSDAIDQLWRRERRELMRPLKVRMGMEEGEEGVDHGGVQQEFFRVVFGDALNPDIGMFSVDPQTRMTWFQPGSPEPNYKYEMLGVLMSLAVYNSVTLPVTFPLAFYRKLLGLKVKKLDHIGDGWPELARGLQDLLDWSEGDVGDIFLRTYEFTYEFAGQQISVNMDAIGRDTAWPPRAGRKGKGKAKTTSFDFSSTGQSGRKGGSEDNTARHSDDDDLSVGHSALRSSVAVDPPAEPVEAPLVTNENRTKYVKDYIFWLTDKSIRSQYEAFARGFYTCLDKTALSIFTPEALKSVIEGIQDIDIDGLREATRYEDGFDETDPFIESFWEIARSFSHDKKKQLLEFVTASDRVPVNGVKSIMFVIQRNGDGDQRLPTSMTCFGRLLLPRYSSKEVLEEKLVKAIENSKGFGAA